MKRFIFAFLLLFIFACGSDTVAQQVGTGGGNNIVQHEHKNANDGGVLYLASNLTTTTNNNMVIALNFPSIIGDIALVCSSSMVNYVTGGTNNFSTINDAYNKMYCGSSAFNTIYIAMTTGITGMSSGSGCTICKTIISGTVGISNQIISNGTSPIYTNALTVLWLKKQ